MTSVTIVTKDNNYSLQNVENYKNETIFDTNEAIQKYSELIIEYFKFVLGYRFCFECDFFLICHRFSSQKFTRFL